MMNMWRNSKVVVLCLLLTGNLCALNGCGIKRQLPVVIVLDANRNVQLIDPNVPFTANQPSVVLVRGYYLQLKALEKDVQCGALIRNPNLP